jgi:predicted lipoprotein with Yx(FWY)xxD motif
MFVMASRSRIALAGITVAGMLALGACTAPTAPEATTAPGAAGTTPVAEAGEGEVYTLVVASGPVGSYLTGEDGKTLYVFKRDTANSGTSACSGSCAENWPPFTASADEKVVGGTGAAGAVGSIPREDGTMQVTYNGMPLYYYGGDNQAGDTNGEGVGGNWNVAAP